MKFDLIAASAACIAISLQGCGGGGDVTTTTTPGGTTTTTPSGPTTTTTNPNPPAPRDGQDVTDLMNSEFNGYKPGDSSTPFGNWIRFSTDETEAVGLYCGGKCFNGKPDCKLSGSVFNSQQMINTQDQGDGSVVAGSAGGWFNYKSVALSGYYINSTLIKTRLGKCLYAWDGASDNKVNNGCGCSQGTQKCDDPQCAYNNMAPPNYTSITDPQSDLVQKSWCGKLPAEQLPADGRGAMCYYKGPAFDTVNDLETEDETHTMLDRRVSNQDKGDAGYGPAKTAWNEYNLDGHRVFEELGKDPAGTVPAMVYSKHCCGGPDGKAHAQAMSKAFQKRFNLPKPLPVIFLDQSIDATTGKASPWVFKAEDQVASDFNLV